MAVTTKDMFGASRAPEPAVAGSYGDPPSGLRLPDSLRLGPVTLAVSDLARSEAWYQTVLGLSPMGALTSTEVRLGAQGATEPLVILQTAPGVQSIRPGSRLGLYHFAILLPDRPALGRFVQHLAGIGARAGASDHLVSEALYLTDPDGLGIEVYADRPRTSWQRLGRELMMASDPLNFPDVVAAAQGEAWTGMPAGTVMGHLHLHVGDLPRASAFYSEALGFDRMVWRYPGALFLGAGGYHHHLGSNTWAAGASSPTERDARLLEWRIVLPARADVDASHEALLKAGFAAPDTAGLVRDPWGTPLRIPGAVGARG
ncbi:MAG: VOC family protein [Gemmatimonadaceae bacterium]|nr:VOC family protein [Gemmatimonadaceae bacterium]